MRSTTDGAARPVETDRSQTVWSGFQHVALVTLLVLIMFTALYVGANVYFNFGDKMQGAPLTPWPGLNTALLGLHIATGFPPLLLGFYTFLPESRRGGNRAHRWVGTIYCVSIWISAICGLLLAAANTRGPIAALGFGCLAVAWFSTTLLAYRTARAKQFIEHRQWMIRSFALTLAVVSVRPLFLMSPPFGLEFDTWYRLCSWLCWVPNLLVAELYVRATHYSGRLALRSWRSASPARTAARGSATASAAAEAAGR